MVDFPKQLIGTKDITLQFSACFGLLTVLLTGAEEHAS
jgi:hypothetical protein